MKGNFKLYIIILAVAMGLFFQFLKNTNWNLSPQQHEEISTSNIKGMDTKAFAISKEEREKTTAQATFRNKQVALNKKMMEQLKKQLGTKNTKVSKLEFGKKKGVKGQGKKKKDKKKTDKKKSDKEKKKVGTVPEGTGSSDVTLEEEAFEQEEVDDAIPYVSSDVSPTTPESLRDKEKKDEEAYEKWAALLLEAPHFQNTSLFIEAHRSQAVSDEVFYTIIGQMLRDDRESMKLLGIRAADSTLYISSFNALVFSLEDSQSSTKVRDAARKGLRKYQEVSQLPLIKSILKSAASPVALVTAASLLNRIINIQKELPVDPEKLKELGHHPQVEVFQDFLPILEELAKSNQDSFVLSSVNTALDTLQALMEV